MATQSPYVAESGSVGELGQPAPRSTDHPSQAPVDRGLPAEQGVREPTGFQLGGKEAGGYGDAESVHPESDISQSVGVKTGIQKHDHPLMATHDTNIRHGHEQSEYVSAAISPTASAHQKRGVGEKLKNVAKGFKDVVSGHKEKQHHQHEDSPGLVGKVNNAVTGQYPGQGTATGNATTGGEEDYGRAGDAKPGVGQEYIGGDPSSQVNKKHEDLQHGRGDVPDQGLKHETGWPQPMPPPSIYNPTLTGPDHYSPKADPSPVEGYAPKYARDQADVPGKDVESSTPGTIGGSSVEPNEAGVRLSSAPDAGVNKADVTSATQSSTPAEPNVKHDVPTVDNTGGQYADSAGNARHEGPRDDNVKKEGLMSKMMDKLHLGAHDRHKQTTT